MDYIFVKSQKRGFEDCGSIYAHVREPGVNRKYALGFKIKVTEWENIRQLNYSSSAFMSSIGITYGQFSTILSLIKIELEQHFDANTAANKIQEIKISILGEEKAKSLGIHYRKQTLLMQYMQEYIADLKSGKRLKRHRAVPVSQGYIDNMQATLKCLYDYQHLAHHKVTIEQVDMTFQRNFVKYLQDRGLKPNTISTRMASLHVIMKSAYFDKKTKKIDWQHPDFIPAQEEVDKIFLTPEQIENLRMVDLNSIESSSERSHTSLEQTRDVFIVGCLTGQRISDFMRISRDMIFNLNGHNFIKLRQVKTGTIVYIPLDVRVKAILDKYGGSLPQTSKITFNKNLRKLGEIMGWTWYPHFDHQPCTKTSKKTPIRFCDMLSSHTARRSFATNSYTAGIPISSIMTVTGHSSERNFRKYLGLQAQDRAIAAAEDFKGFIKME